MLCKKNDKVVEEDVAQMGYNFATCQLAWFDGFIVAVIIIYVYMNYTMLHDLALYLRSPLTCLYYFPCAMAVFGAA